MSERNALHIFCGFMLMLVPVSGSSAAPELTADQIVAKSIAASGGLEAWRKVESMAWIGHIESANAPAPSMAFSLELKRPHKTRFELKVQNQTAIHIFDGAHGWKLHPAGNGKPGLLPYTADELSYARDVSGIGGALVDGADRGTAVALEGMDEVEGRKAYRMGIKLQSGATQRVWIDAQTFLEVKSERESRNGYGRTNKVTVYYRNYQKIEGLQMPMLIESSAGTGNATDRMVINQVLLNPVLDDRMFARPNLPSRPNVGRRGEVTVEISDSPAARSIFRPPQSSMMGSQKSGLSAPGSGAGP